MAPLCAGIFQSQDYDCDPNNYPVGGADERIVLWNYDDYLSNTLSSSVDSIVESITLKPGKVAYFFQGQRQSVEPEQRLVPGRYSAGYDHHIAFKVWVPNSDPSALQNAKNNLEAMGRKLQMGVIQNKDKTFELYGLNQGLEIINSERILADLETNGAFSLLLKTSDNSVKEPKYPQTLFITDFATSLDVVDDLLNLPIVDNITPIAGGTAGTDTYTISGSNFFDTATVPAADVTSVDWVNGAGTLFNQASNFTVSSDTSIAISSSIALSADTYKIRITTSTGIADSALIVVIS